MVALVAVMLGTGNTTPRLGIDLAGGTSVTLKATSNQQSAINPANMATAAGIMRDRVNGTGVTEATVQVQGNDEIVVNAPKGTSSTQLANELAQTAKLFFRPVLAEQVQANAATLPKSSASPSASSTGGAKPSASASASGKPQATGSGATASPSASKTQGDAVSQDLKASSSASPHASASATAHASSSAAAAGTPKAAATPSAAPTGAVSGQVGGTVPAALQTQFAATDCTTEAGQAAAQLAANKAAETDQVVACSQDASGGTWVKYALDKVAVDGTSITKAQSNLSTQTGQWEVDLSFDSHGSGQFANVTGQLAKNPQPPTNEFAIQLDGKVQSAPTVSSAITGGQATISGSFDQASASSLANVLSYGSLPLNFQIQEVVTVSPELGSSQLTAGLIAGLIGLILVVLYSLAYYRGLGLVAVASLIVSAVLTWSLMSLLGGAIGFALNLPAVCGAIVAIGITADSFVVYFERVRDELREGASLRPAVRNAWPRARRTILVSDFVSFLAAAVLYFFTVGKVQGFAFTLGLTTLLDVVVVFLFTKPLMTLLARRKFFNSGHPWSGLSPERLGVRNPLRDSRNSRRPARPAAGKEA
ncbi:protein translocase subunit SecD [Streptacidiphilus pinicola]|uniref:Protein translocase subunit SecD n=2 Tax=Streptacidiphilus pinicola TaxID=2219663 RepID=A0A2X0IIS3_9ACTN|nr:protein translocase subunit SecD [Streptacidiphilus pinicola]RAG83523.1 protein translocase subunit SecD [Streptacidiphilus pinicola]